MTFPFLRDALIIKGSLYMATVHVVGDCVTFHSIWFPAEILIINIRPVLLGHIRM